MSLRLRVALLVAAVVAATVAVVGIWAVRAAESELTDEVDQDLQKRAQQIMLSEERGEGRFAGVRGRGFSADRVVRSAISELLHHDPFGVFVSPDAHLQFVVRFNVVSDGDETLGVRVTGFGERDADDHAHTNTAHVTYTLDDSVSVEAKEATLEKAALKGPVIETIKAYGAFGGSKTLRMVTLEVSDGFYVQLGRPIDEVEQAVDDLADKVLLVGFSAVLLTAVAGWFLAGRAVRPIVRLAKTAEEVSATGDLERTVDGDGKDEVGRLAHSFRTMLGALAASRRQQHRLVADASHELRTPLTSLRTNVDVLRRTPDLPVSEREAVLADLDAEISELSMVSAELVELATDLREDEEVTLVEVVPLVEKIAERAQARTGREVVVRVERAVEVEARPEALTRALRNLVDNAIKFSNGGGVPERVDNERSVASSPKTMPINIPINIIVDGAAVTVHDAGPGIPEEDRERVFERFHRLDSTRDLPGSGLGLAIVRQVADVHGGSVEISDSPLGGVAVTFSIPEMDSV